MNKPYLDELYLNHNLSKDKLAYILNNITKDDLPYLQSLAYKIKEENFGNKIYLRGLLEISNYCSQDCLYCGINNKARNVIRYRLSKEDIIKQAKMAIKQGIKTIVLQGGEDPKLTDDFIISIIKDIKALGDIAITLSLGIRSYESYKNLRLAGADRYLLRHESATKLIFNKYHHMQDFDKRRKALNDLKDLGYQFGAGFIVGLENNELITHLDDLIFLKEINPQMVGIGPFLPSENTPLKDKETGSVFNTLVLLALIRLLLPKVLLPATTALATLSNDGYMQGITSGCNVIMPNITPNSYKNLYKIYDHKKNDELDENNSIKQVIDELAKNNLEFSKSRGDY